jgi:hypothetical protein
MESLELRHCKRAAVRTHPKSKWNERWKNYSLSRTTITVPATSAQNYQRFVQLTERGTCLQIGTEFECDVDGNRIFFQMGTAMYMET